MDHRDGSEISVLPNLQAFANREILTFQLHTLNSCDFTLDSFSRQIFDQFFDDLIFNSRQINRVGRQTL